MIITIVFISASDVMLASTTAYFLLKTRKLVLPQYVPYCFSTDFCSFRFFSTTGVINALIRLTFQTATPAVIW